MTNVWLCGSCRSLNQADANRCYRCREKRADSEHISDLPGAPGTNARPARDPSLLGATILGVAAAVASTAAWVAIEGGPTRRPISFAWLVGVAIGFGTLLGGFGRSSTPIVLMSTLLAIAAVATGEYLIVSRFLAEATGQLPVDGAIPIAAPEQVVAALQEALPDAPLRPILWVVAVASAFLLPWRAMVGSDNERPD